MTSIMVTENQLSEENLLYVQSTAGEIFSHAGCSARIFNTDGRAILQINCPEYYHDVILAEIVDKVSEIITIKYKTEFFKKNLKVGGLSSTEKEILYASLIAADLDDDKRYAFDRLKNSKLIAIDGVFNFRLKPLKKKWQDVAECVPPCFMNSQLKEFISYLLENKKKQIYIDNGKVYDAHYRRLNRSELLGGDKVKIVREVLLSNCGGIEVSGKIPEEDEFYLKEYYSDNITFSAKYTN